jgi:YidC/Oxa1 family membrane protein insertase
MLARPALQPVERRRSGPRVIVADILAPIENILASILDWLGPHGFVGLPWAWAIVALTVIVRMALVWLTVKQIHSMQNLQRHAPEMKEIQRKFKGDKQNMNEELMKFYKENRINPAASCLPILLQIPVFFSLYRVLRHFKTTTNYIPGDNLNWLGLINILHPAKYGWGPLLIIIYVGSQLASTYFMSATVDRTQRILFFALPFLFIPFVIHFKAGLVLYWATTNLWTVGQGIVTRRLVPRTKVAPPKRTSRTPAKEERAAPAAAQAVVEKNAAAVAAAGPRKVKRKRKRGSRR